LSDAYVVVGIT